MTTELRIETLDEEFRVAEVYADNAIPRGFVKMPKALLHYRRLSDGAKVLAGVLLGYARENDKAFPSHALLAKDLDKTERSVIRLLEELTKEHLIDVEPRGRGRNNVYHLKRLKDLDGVAEGPINF